MTTPSWFMRLSFKGKVFLLLIPIIILISLAFSYQAVNTQRSILRHEMISRGEAIALIVATNAELPILSENIELLTRSAHALKEIRDVTFVAFFRKDFTTLLHEGVSPGYKPRSDIKPGRVQFFEQAGFFEFYVPVFTIRTAEEIDFYSDTLPASQVKEHVGWALIGLSKQVINNSVRAIIISSLLYGLLFIFGGSILMYALISLALRPVTNLLNAVKALKDGEYHEIETVHATDEIGRLTDEFNRMSHAIKEREGFLNSIVENIPNMIFVKDAAELRYVRFNRAGEELIGYSREELYGKTSHELFPQAMADSFSLQDREVLSSGRMLDIPEDVMYSVRNGERILHSRKIPILDEKGKSQYLLGISEDITEHKLAEAELARYRNQLEELIQERTAELTVAKEQAETANRAKSEFLANMSHELRTPLNAVMGYTQILKRQENMTDLQRQQLEIMRGSGEHLLTLINDILDVGKIEAQRMEIENTPFDLPSLIRQVLNITRLNAENKELLFQYEEQTPLPSYVRGDERKLRQILLNLLSNAVKYTQRGSVTLRVTYSCSEPGILGCEIVDSGIGVPADKREAIFEPFIQLNRDRQAREGTGLGLNITRRLLELMQGEIGVTSEIGVGSTFWFELPLPLMEGVANAADQGAVYSVNVPDISGTPVTDENTVDDMPVVPLAELDELYELAMLGDMRRIEQWADRLVQSDAMHRHVADKLRRLAGGFKTRAIITLVNNIRGTHDEF